jgi:hypothetical protein
LAHDSTFVPALWHLAQSLWWRGGGDTSYESYLIRAGELNHGLPRRDSLLVAADCVWVAVGRFNELTPQVRRSLITRLFGTLEEGVRLYPEDPELWYHLAEVRFHQDWMHRTDPRQILDAFDRTIALDSSFVPAYVHAPTLALFLYGRQGWDRYITPYFASNPSDDQAQGRRLLDAVFKAAAVRPDRTDSILRADSLYPVMVALFDAWHFPDSAETAIRLGRFLASSRSRFNGLLDEPDLRRQALAGVLGVRGHLREALSLVNGTDQPAWYSALPGEIVLARGTNLPDEADAMFKHWLRQTPFWPPGEAPVGGPPGSLLYALPWWAARRDTLALSQYARRADSAQRAASRPIEKEIAQYEAEAALAYSALTRGDTLAALRRFEALPHDVTWGALDRLTEGQILTRQGRDPEALKLFEEAFPIFWWGPARVLAALDAARAAERLGQRERATAHYQFVVDAWRHADPELQHYVDEARQGLARLTAEPRR